MMMIVIRRRRKRYHLLDWCVGCLLLFVVCCLHPRLVAIGRHRRPTATRARAAYAAPTDELAKKAKMAGREMSEMWRIENGGRPSIDVDDSTQFNSGGATGSKGGGRPLFIYRLLASGRHRPHTAREPPARASCPPPTRRRHPTSIQLIKS